MFSGPQFEILKWIPKNPLCFDNDMGFDVS